MLVVAAAGGGALSVGATQTMVPQSAGMFEAVRALGGNSSGFRLSDINPLAAYEDVRRKITSRNYGDSFKIGSSAPSFTTTGPIKLPEPARIDMKQFDRAISAGITARINQDYRRNQDLMVYSRNPMGWHGRPPF